MTTIRVRSPRLFLATRLLPLSAILLSLFSSAPAYANRDDVAVVIGNRDYSRAKTFNVEFAGNDAEAMRAFLIDRLGFEEQNIIFLQDATLGQMQQIFGDAANPEGQLWKWAREGRSNVFVFYSGHGATDVQSKMPYLIPIDVDPERAASGYSLDLLDRNLAKLKAHLGGNIDVVLMLDACFSGQTAGGQLGGYSGGLIPNIAPPSQGIIRLAAAGANQVANWDKQRRLGLFTSKFLDAVDGAADKKPHGDVNGRTDWQEVTRYLDEEVRYTSRREYSRDQTPELPRERGPAWQFEAKETERGRKARACREEPERWKQLTQAADGTAIRQAQASFQCPAMQKLAAAWISDADKKQTDEDIRGKAKDSENKDVEDLRRAREELDRARKELEASRTAALQPPPPPTCETLWHSRNAIFHRFGYCFGSAKGISIFSNDGCFRNEDETWQAMGESNRQIINSIRALERGNAC